MHIPHQNIPLDFQVFSFLNKFHEFKKTKFLRSKKIAFEGFLQPTPLSKLYRVKIEYEFRCRPTVTLPDESFSSDRPPHTFKDGSLCLYHRNGLGAWNSKRPLSDLIPMITHWLWCYEIWLVTEKWYGEEYPHDPAEIKRAT
jgi:hypothetical protein